MQHHRKLQHLASRPLRGHGVVCRGKRADNRAGSRVLNVGGKGLVRRLRALEMVG